MIGTASWKQGWHAAVLPVAAALLTAAVGLAQSNARLLLASGAGVPEHAGFVFGPFSSLSMDRNKQIVFLSSLVSPRSQMNAIVRSSGVSFSVVAFQGLHAPISDRSFDSFLAPSMNDEGQIAFTAMLRGSENGQPAGAGVFRADGSTIRVIASTDQASPDGTNFQEFAAPVISSMGNILFGARTGQGSGLFFWTPTGIQKIAIPNGINLKGQEMLSPILSTGDQCVLITSGVSSDAAREQLFRALATKSFQALSPPPPPEQVTVILPPKTSEKPIAMLLVALEGEKAEVGFLEGDATLAVEAKTGAGSPAKPFIQWEGQAAAPGGNILFAAIPSGQASDLALYCYCDGGVLPMTTSDDFLTIAPVLAGRPVESLTSDSAHTAAFIAPTGSGNDANAIYVVSLSQ